MVEALYVEEGGNVIFYKERENINLRLSTIKHSSTVVDKAQYRKKSVLQVLNFQINKFRRNKNMFKTFLKNWIHIFVK